MTKKIKILLCLFIVVSAFLLTSCDEVDAVKSVIPKFSMSLPNVFSGAYVIYPENSESSGNTGFTEAYFFNSKDSTFDYSDASSFSSGNVFSYKYTTFTTTECTGVITLEFVNGQKKTLSFVWRATALRGPENLTLGSVVYEYDGRIDSIEGNE